MNKLFKVICMSILILCTAAGVSAADFQNSGFTLSIPDEITEQLIIDVPENDGSGILFSVAERKSVEIGKKQELNWEGIGWLFSIQRIDENELHEMLCYEMFGSQVFAKDQKGDYYLFNHPTDVRMVRDDYTDPKNFEDWSALNEWSATVPDTFIKGNYGLTSEKHGNTELDIQLARALYMEGTKYSVSTTQFGPLEADGVTGSEVYLKQLSENVKFTYKHDGIIPDGEYVVLNFPDEDYRFDFFLMDGSENLIRQVWFDGQNELLYEAVYDDGTTKASDVMLNFYLMLAQTAGLYDPSEKNIIGTFADTVAGRCSIEISNTEEAGTYQIRIWWGSSASQTAFWEMTGVRMGNNSSLLRYEDARHSIITFSSEGEESEEVVYENGKGTISLQSENELRWNDETEHAADDLLFVRAK